MATLRLQLTTTAPLFLKGANPKGDPEFRAASVRGQLRYWLRALVGAETQDPSKVWERESAVFGSTERGSVVTVRFSKGIQQPEAQGDEPSDGRGRYKPYLLPHRSNPREQSPDYAIRPGTTVTLSVSTRPAVNFPQSVLDALSLWLLLGGVGKRSRRMMGGLQLTKVTNEKNIPLPVWMTTTPDSVDGWIKVYKKQLDAIKHGTAPSTTPTFPILHPNHCCILVGQPLFSSATDANQALFGLLRNNVFRPNSDAFGYAGGGGRRASPVIAQVRKLADDHYFPVLTIFRSNPLKPRDWTTIMNNFIDAAKTTFNATRVYGVEKFS